MESVKTAIIVLNWNGWKDTVECLESLLKLEGSNAIFVCDNASSDDSVFQLREWATKRLHKINHERQKDGMHSYILRDEFDNSSQESAKSKSNSTADLFLLSTGRNGGYAAGNNFGIRRAQDFSFDYYWILNNDTTVQAQALYWLIRAAKENTKIGICGSTLVYDADRKRIQACGGAEFLMWKGRGVPLGNGLDPKLPLSKATVESKLKYVIGASMLVSHAFVCNVGLMTEDYFLYWEEIDWCARARGRYTLGYAPNSIVYHKVGATIGTNDFAKPSALSDFYLTRNRIRFCVRHSKISLPFVILESARNALKEIFHGDVGRAVVLIRAILQFPFKK